MNNRAELELHARTHTGRLEHERRMHGNEGLEFYITKIICGVLILVVDLIFVLIPRTARAFFDRHTSAIACVTGGILVSSALMQLLQQADLEVHEKVKGFFELFPLEHFMCCVGFMVAMIIEGSLRTFELYKNLYIIPPDTNKEKCEIIGGTLVCTPECEGKCEGRRRQKAMVRAHVSPILVTGDEESIASHTTTFPGGIPLEQEITHKSEYEIDEEGSILDVKKGKRIPGVVLTVALSISNFVTGLVIGAQLERMPTIIVTVAAIGNDWAEAIALALTLQSSFRAHPPRQLNICLLFYLISTQVGIAIGSCIQVFVESEKTSGTIAGALTALAAGFFLYVATINMIAEETKVKDDDTVFSLLKKYAFVIVGFLSIILIVYFV